MILNWMKNIKRKKLLIQIAEDEAYVKSLREGGECCPTTEGELAAAKKRLELLGGLGG